MSFHALKCPSCGGPLPPRAWRAVVACAYCGSAVSLDGAIVRAADFRRALAEMEETHARGDGIVRLGGVAYRILGHLSSGKRCDVLLAERASPLTERVAIKVLRGGDPSPLDREWEVLHALQESQARGSAVFSLRLPQPVARAKLEWAASGTACEALAVRYASGFVHTLKDVADAHSSRLNPRHFVWIWRRLLEILGFIHASGWTHDNIEPGHVLIHARDHGVLLAGWSAASRLHEMPAAQRRALVQSARAAASVLGGVAPPPPLAGILRPYLDDDPRAMPTNDAWDLADQVAEAAHRAFGPPKYVELSMPRA